jgi:hypothetical protein
MSYDLFFFHPTPGADPVDEALARMAAYEEDAGPPDAWVRATADALRAALPWLEEAEPDFEEVARNEGSTAEEVRRRWRHVELVAPEGGSGLLLAVRDREVEAALPYWHSDDTPWRDVWAVADVLAGRGLEAFDPQLGRLLTPADRAAAERMYADTLRAVRHEVDRVSGVSRPWWKFWG